MTLFRWRPFMSHSGASTLFKDGVEVGTLFMNHLPESSVVIWYKDHHYSNGLIVQRGSPPAITHAYYQIMAHPEEFYMEMML